MRIIRIILISFLVLMESFAKGHHHNNNGSCYAQINDIPFGVYNPFDRVVKRTYTTLRVVCNSKNNIVFTVKVLGGNSNNPAKRFLYSASTGGKLYYNLFYRNCILGDGTQNTCVISGMTRCRKKHFTERSFCIVGVIPPMQNVPVADDYQDHLTVIIEY
ncbi:spore coat protein U domain-containing protein [Persephonella sp.]|uniref:spore coat protein U domain-containing protein n=1 Tax=Persephonella sp. TaxID=2060922 RepID=UPI00261587B8|nr:spore coat protein U domain-containing protein [Persephonella sp.]